MPTHSTAPSIHSTATSIHTPDSVPGDQYRYALTNFVRAFPRYDDPVADAQIPAFLIGHRPSKG